MIKSISEILAEASEKATIEERVDVLHKHNSEVLQGVLKIAHTPGIKFKLPEGTPPFNPYKGYDNEGVLYAEWRKMYLFIEGMSNDNLSDQKRQLMFVQLLESLTPSEVKLIIALKDKKFNYPKINKRVVNKAYPGLLGD